MIFKRFAGTKIEKQINIQKANILFCFKIVLNLIILKPVTALIRSRVRKC